MKESLLIRLEISESQGCVIISMRWAYPPTKDHQIQGSCCWCCNKALECDPDFLEATITLAEAKVKVKDNDQEFILKLREVRPRIIDIAIENLGRVILGLFICTPKFHDHGTVSKPSHPPRFTVRCRRRSR